MALQAGDWWKSGNGNVYRFDGSKVHNVGADNAETGVIVRAGQKSGGGGLFGKQISDPFHGQGEKQAAPEADASAIIGGGTVDPSVARMSNLKGDIRGYQGDVASVYDQLFAGLDALIRSRANEIDKTAGENMNELTGQYTASIPGIESSYAALGSADSTDNTYAKVDAKEGYDKSIKEVGDQKTKDLNTLSAYDQDTRAGWIGERDALNRIFGRLDQAENENELYDMRNQVETKLDGAKASKSKLKTDGELAKDIAGKTDSSSRVASIQDSLSNLLNSSLAGGVKDAAVAAIGQSAGLTDEEKNQIKQNNPYQTN